MELRPSSLPREHRKRGGRPARGLLLAAACGLSCLGCNPEIDWTPGPEETTTSFLATEVEEAQAALDEAQQDVVTDPEAAAESLARARSALVRLQDYYLPLLEARARAHNALLWYRHGEADRVLDELAAIESVFLAVSDRHDAQLSRELDAPLEMVVGASAAVRAGRADAAELIERLASRTNQMLLKGGLVLGGSALESEG
jgi:hypothetical protein